MLPCFLVSGGCGSGGGSSPPILLAISISPTNATFVAGTTLQYTATGIYSNGLAINVTQSVTWSSSVPTVATIDSKGSATAVAAGTTAIKAALNGISATTNLTVTPTGANVMQITVNGNLCSSATSAGYINKPCVSVTVCNPNSNTCQTITD
ncbi:DUF3443 family protein, partial [Geomonas sp.]|uniref:DUF3443 family protein n=1 Tax=Geomonas sp. TaxID=2651584 RepID=UPI002B4A7CB6